jgi:Macrocin-O-methyltransferase (TylF)
MQTPAPFSNSDCCNLYLDLLEQTLTGAILEDVAVTVDRETFEPSLASAYDARTRLVGWDWPSHAQTMVGIMRLRNLRRLVSQVLNERIPGDFIETGVWRGGACIYMRALLTVFGIKDRRVWLADSFDGLPPPNPASYPADANSNLHKIRLIAVPVEEVKNNFAKYNMLDEQVVFLKGWFKDTLPGAPIEKLAILRLDGDMYESTIQALDSLYYKLSPGGFVIVDDYFLGPCRRAVDDFRRRNVIADGVEDIDGFAAYWRKT